VRVAVTGRPGVGKTTLCLKVFDALRDELDVKGFVTKEVRVSGRRVGFKLVDLVSGESLWLARVDAKSPVRVGRYGVLLESIDEFAERIESYRDADLIIIDEIGPMELKSRRFVEAVEGIVDRDGLLFTIHLKSQHPLLRRIRSEFEVLTLTEENRDRMVEEVVRRFAHDR